MKDGFTRRQVLKGLGVALAAAGCGSPAEGELFDGGGASPDANATPDACETGTATAEELLGQIDHIVVLCMENRSFDHYLGALRLAEGRAVDGLTGTEVNPAPDGTPVGVFKLDDFTPEDPSHDWDACHDQWNGGANDGFVKAHEGDSQAQVMGYHLREQLPVIYALADGGALCDRWFCSLLGPTWPNRYFLHGGTSSGIKANVPNVGSFRSIFSALKEKGASVKNYYHDLPWCSGAYFKTDDLDTIEHFLDDAAAGTLPNFSIIDPHFFGEGANDDHPEHDARLGQALLGTVFAALAQSPQWSRSLFILTYDEHGGFHDHVAPPTAEDDREDFRQLGFRVPSIVAGPHVRKGCVISTTFEHSSIVATACKRWGIAPLTTRVAAAADLSSCLRLGPAQEPPTLPAMTVTKPSAARRVAASHEELWAAAESGVIPRALDRRAEGIDISHRMLAAGERLGAVRIR
jgi:phospholipase C